MEGKVAVIIGGTSGVGLSALEHFASKGASVVFSGRRAIRGKAEEKKLKEKGFKVTYVKADVTEKKDMKELYETAEKLYGGIDIVINSAGLLGVKKSIEEMEEKYMREVMEVNFFAAFECIKLAIPFLRKRGSGAIFNISADSSIDPLPGFSHYCCSKAALNMLTSVAALDLAKDKIKIYALMLLVFESEMSDYAAKDLGFADAKALAAAFNPSKKIGKGSEVADFILDIVQGKTKYQSGDSILLDAEKTSYNIHDAMEIIAKQKLASKLGKTKESMLCAFSRREDLKKELKESKEREKEKEKEKSRSK